MDNKRLLERIEDGNLKFEEEVDDCGPELRRVLLAGGAEAEQHQQDEQVDPDREHKAPGAAAQARGVGGRGQAIGFGQGRGRLPENDAARLAARS